MVDIPPEVYLDRIARELKTIRESLIQAINHSIDAEYEIPERMRRFVAYMHDIHDVSYMYEERGQPTPAHILREMERCDDRFRQLVKEFHGDGGIFEKVRREMAKDPENRWDHTRLLFPPKETTNEARPSESERSTESESGTESPRRVGRRS